MGSLHHDIVAETVMQGAGTGIARFGTVVNNSYSSICGEPGSPIWTILVQVGPDTYLSLVLYDLHWQNWVIHISLRMGRDQVLLQVIKFEEETKGFCLKCRSEDCDEFTCPIEAPIIQMVSSQPGLMSQEITRIFRKVYQDQGCSRY